jgi:hypothetical protein
MMIFQVYNYYIETVPHLESLARRILASGPLATALTIKKTTSHGFIYGKLGPF